MTWDHGIKQPADIRRQVDALARRVYELERRRPSAAIQQASTGPRRADTADFNRFGPVQLGGIAGSWEWPEPVELYLVVARLQSANPTSPASSTVVTITKNDLPFGTITLGPGVFRNVLEVPANVRHFNPPPDPLNPFNDKLDAVVTTAGVATTIRVFGYAWAVGT